MAAQLARSFIRKHSDNGTHDSTCPLCNRTLGSVRIELTLDELEDSHLCQECLARRKSEPQLFRAKWVGLLGSRIRSIGGKIRVGEGTAAESPDMNTIPGTCGGSVSSF